MQEELQQFIADELHQLGTDFAVQRANALRARKIQTTGALSASVQFEIEREARQEATALLLAFEEYGRFIDMKRLKAPQADKIGSGYIEAIEAWIKARGWEEKLIEKYKTQRKLRKVPKNVLNMIAWGIALKRAKKVRPRRWWNSSKSAFSIQVFNQIVGSLPDKTADGLLKEFRPQ
jgi:hypothetical protein